MKHTLLAVALILSSLSTIAQPKPLIETYEVRVTSVEVVVTDSERRPIRGLDRSQFKVFENGVLQEITNFSEVDLAGVPEESDDRKPVPVRPDVERRHIQIFIDEYSADPFHRKETLEELRKTLGLTLSEGDEVSIVRWTRRLKVELQFTRDLQKVFETIERIKAEGAQGASFASDRRQTARRIEANVMDGPAVGYPAAYQSALMQARFYGEELRENLRTLAEDLKASMSAMGGLNGRKALIFVGENLPRNPGIEMFEIADRAFEPYLGPSISSRGQAIQRGESLTIQSIAHAANANGVAFYTVSAGLGSSGKNAAESTPLLGRESVQALTYSNNAGSFEQIASATGGATSLHTNTLDGMLKRLASDLQAYYSIGYRPSDSEDSVRSIKVEVDDPSAIVRTRTVFVAKSSEEVLADRALSCLFRQICEVDFQISVTTGEPKKKRRRRYLVPIEVRVPMANLTLVPQGDKSIGGFSVHIVAVNETGGLSEVSGKSQRVSVPVNDLPTIQDKYVTWTVELLAEKGRTKITVGVADEVSLLMGFAKAEVVSGK